MASDMRETVNPRYISGISDEPKQMLQPISGYAHEPLLPLEEACEPLLNIVPRLPAHIWIAKQNSKNPADGLTQDESAAIRLYTMEWDSGADEPHTSLYAHLNRTLKQIDRTKLRPWFRYLKLFVTGLAKLPAAPRQTIWRGVRKDFSGDYSPGAEVTWWAFSSCTTSLSVLESDLYLGNAGTRTLFSIETINARTIRSHSHFTTEDEILLLPGTFFEVRSRLNPAPDLYLVHLQQKIPPFALLEPPFEGAMMFPPTENQSHPNLNATSNDKPSDRPWYTKKTFFFRIGIALLLIILIVLLTTILLTRKKSLTPSATTSAPISFGQYDRNTTVYPPVSVAYAFYAFDNNLQDLYCLHDGQLNGSAGSYIPGYVGTGSAIVLNQSMPTWISAANPFNISSTNLTIEAFIILFNDSINANLVQFSSNISLYILMGRLGSVLNGGYEVSSYADIPLNQWHHIAVVYDVDGHYGNLYIDGKTTGQISYISEQNPDSKNITMIIGNGFEGIIDQLSISLEAKGSDRILWDATVAAYYPLDGDHNGRLLDYGPNGLNASSAGTQSIPGLLREAIRFITSGAYYQAGGFTALNIANHAFSIGLWVRLENQPGVVLTIANSVSCLLILGIRSSDNRTIVYLPNATNTNMSVSLIGTPVTNNQWIHMAFTWSVQNQAQFYRNAAFQGRNSDASKLNNGVGEPMVVTLGMYRGSANCSGAEGIDMTTQFSGSIDEVYIFSRELQQNEVEKLNSTTKF